jgi:hypothetical protein
VCSIGAGCCVVLMRRRPGSAFNRLGCVPGHVKVATYRAGSAGAVAVAAALAAATLPCWKWRRTRGRGSQPSQTLVGCAGVASGSVIAATSAVSTRVGQQFRRGGEPLTIG